MGRQVPARAQPVCDRRLWSLPPVLGQAPVQVEHGGRTPVRRRRTYVIPSAGGVWGLRARPRALSPLSAMPAHCVVLTHVVLGGLHRPPGACAPLHDALVIKLMQSEEQWRREVTTRQKLGVSTTSLANGVIGIHAACVVTGACGAALGALRRDCQGFADLVRRNPFHHRCPSLPRVAVQRPRPHLGAVTLRGLSPDATNVFESDPDTLTGSLFGRTAAGRLRRRALERGPGRARSGRTDGQVSVRTRHAQGRRQPARGECTRAAFRRFRHVRAYLNLGLRRALVLLCLRASANAPFFAPTTGPQP